MKVGGNLRRPVRLLLTVTVLALAFLLFRAEKVRSAMTEHRLALSASEACLASEVVSGADSADPQRLRHGSEVQKQWWAAVHATCQRRPEETVHEHVWQPYLALTDERADTVQTIYPESMTLATFAVQHHPHNARLRFWQGHALQANGFADAAIVAYKQGLLLEPNDADAWLSLGQLYREAENWRAAVESFDYACRLGDRNSSGCPSAGALYLAHEEYPLAAARYRTALRELPGWPGGQRGLGQALLGMGQEEEALHYLSAAAAAGDRKAARMLDELLTAHD